jgi:hypothetical protein
MELPKFFTTLWPAKKGTSERKGWVLTGAKLHTQKKHLQSLEHAITKLEETYEATQDDDAYLPVVAYAIARDGYLAEERVRKVAKVAKESSTGTPVPLMTPTTKASLDDTTSQAPSPMATNVFPSTPTDSSKTKTPEAQPSPSDGAQFFDIPVRPDVDSPTGLSTESPIRVDSPAGHPVASPTKVPY